MVKAEIIAIHILSIMNQLLIIFIQFDTDKYYLFYHKFDFLFVHKYNNNTYYVHITLSLISNLFKILFDI